MELESTNIYLSNIYFIGLSKITLLVANYKQ
jgi:hypothetical protein